MARWTRLCASLWRHRAIATIGAVLVLQVRYAMRLTDEIGLRKVWLMNDLEANAWGISALEEKDFCLIAKQHTSNMLIKKPYY